MVTEELANATLDDVIHSAIHLNTEDGDAPELSAVQKLQSIFGAGAAPLAAHLVLLGVARGFDHGLVHATPGTDRTDILASALRRVHTKEEFGDCVEDGEPYPCPTIRAIDLVAGPVAQDSDVAEETVT